jgi:hypothetical protein
MLLSLGREIVGVRNHFSAPWGIPLHCASDDQLLKDAAANAVRIASIFTGQHDRAVIPRALWGSE